MSHANNHYMLSHDSSQPSIYINYLDLNNMYAWAMSQLLPVDGHKQILDVDSWNAQKIHDLTRHDLNGYLLDVDVDYPSHLPNAHN